MKNEIEKLKKIELHIHLVGSALVSTLSEILKISESTLRDNVITKEKCANLSDYLTKFDLATSCMQDKENITKVAKDLVDSLEKDNIIYAEIRFAPMLHTKKGLSYDDIISSVLEGLNSNKNIKTNLILCMMRGFPLEENLKTIDIAYKYLNKGVCAIDLAGPEDKYPLDNYLELFNIIKEKNIPFTIHAGENGDFNEVNKAIKVGASRIGHGIHAIDSQETMNLLKEKNILLEICPTSNVQTNSITTYDSHPIKTLYENGIKISINTDNKTVSNINLSEEYIKLHVAFGFNIENFKEFNLNAIDAAFITESEKEQLKNEI